MVACVLFYIDGHRIFHLLTMEAQTLYILIDCDIAYIYIYMLILIVI